MNDEEKGLVHMLANSVAALAARLERVVEELLLVRRTNTDMHATIDEHRHEQRHQLQLINERLAVLSKDVDDVEKVAREVTGQYPKGDPEHAAVGAIKAFGALPASARWTLVLLAPSLVAIGMAVHELFFK